METQQYAGPGHVIDKTDDLRFPPPFGLRYFSLRCGACGFMTDATVSPEMLADSVLGIGNAWVGSMGWAPDPVRCCYCTGSEPDAPPEWKPRPEPPHP